MTIIQLLVTIAVVGVLLWLANTQIPMQNTVRQIMNAVVVVILVIWLLKLFGILDAFDVPVPRIR